MSRKEWTDIGKKSGWLKTAMIDYGQIPSITMQNLQRMKDNVEQGIKPNPEEYGSFMGAVIRNDLFEAMARADEDNAANMRHICGFIINKIGRGNL